MKHSSRLLIYNSYNENERLLIYYKKYKFNNKHKFNTIQKIYSFTFTCNEIIKRGAAERTYKTQTSPIVRVQLFQKLGG